MNKTIDPPISGFSFTRTGINTMKPSSLKRAIERAFAAELVPFVKGSPGL